MKYRSTKEERFDSIYRSYADEIYRACLYMAKDHDTAQELAQQAFFKFYDCFEDVSPECVYAYLFRIAKNLFYNYERDLKREVKTDVDAEEENQGEMLTESLEDEYFREQQRVLKTELSNNILLKVREENESWYNILNMIYFKDKNYEEISEELGITKEVLYSKIHRAKRWVRKHYGKEFNDITDMA